MIMICLRDSRNRESDPILGVVPIKSVWASKPHAPSLLTSHLQFG
jgi:hypothetical protein